MKLFPRLAQFFRNVVLVQYAGLALATLAISVGVHFSFGHVLTGANIEVMLMNFVFEGIIALGMTLVIISGGIDLSVASVFAFGEILVAKLMVEAGVPMTPAIGITLVACAAIGAVNGILVIALRVHPLIITMGTLLTLRGVNLAITQGASVSGFSQSLRFWVKATWPGSMFQSSFTSWRRPSSPFFSRTTATSVSCTLLEEASVLPSSPALMSVE